MSLGALVTWAQSMLRVSVIDGLDREPRRQEEQCEVTEIAGGYQLASRFCRITGARRNIRYGEGVIAVAEDSGAGVVASSVDRTTGPSPVFNVRGSGVDTASDVRFGGALAGIIFENCAIGSKDTFSFVNEESSIFGVNDIVLSEGDKQKRERRM